MRRDEAIVNNNLDFAWRSADHGSPRWGSICGKQYMIRDGCLFKDARMRPALGTQPLIVNATNGAGPVLEVEMYQMFAIRTLSEPLRIVVLATSLAVTIMSRAKFGHLAGVVGIRGDDETCACARTASCPRASAHRRASDSPSIRGGATLWSYADARSSAIPPRSYASRRVHPCPGLDPTRCRRSVEAGPGNPAQLHDAFDRQSAVGLHFFLDLR
jgi:hypothetical protein